MRAVGGAEVAQRAELGREGRQRGRQQRVRRGLSNSISVMGACWRPKFQLHLRRSRQRGH